jgi:hypothetical protein
MTGLKLILSKLTSAVLRMLPVISSAETKLGDIKSVVLP